MKNLVRADPGEAEHADLVGDVLPVSGGPLLGEQRAQLGAHCDDPVGHALHVDQPVAIWKKIEKIRILISHWFLL